MKRWGIVLAALLLTAGCALADDSGFRLDNERAQAIYWEYSGAVIEDYAEVETAERSFAFILFKQEQRRMMKVYAFSLIAPTTGCPVPAPERIFSTSQVVVTR